MTLFAEAHDIHLTVTSPYHPQSNGLTERMNGIIKTGLKKLQNESDWDLYLPAVLFATRTTQQASSQYSPFMLMYGTEARLPESEVKKLKKRPDLMTRVNMELTCLRKIRRKAAQFIQLAQK